MPGDAGRGEVPHDDAQGDELERLWRGRTTPVATARRDDGLRRRLADGPDPGAVAALVRRHGAATWRLAAVITLDVDRASRATERAWAEVRDGRTTLSARNLSTRGWLLQDVRHHARKLGASPGRGIDRATRRFTLPFVEAPDVTLVVPAFVALAEEARTALWLRVVEQLPPSAIAAVTEVNEADVLQLLPDALADLRASTLRALDDGTPPRCASTLERIALYLDGTLRPHDHAVLTRHVRTCRRCAAWLDTLESPGFALLERLMDPPADVAERLQAAAAETGSG